MHQSAVALLKLETELRLGVQNNDFAMHYQPIVDLDERSHRRVRGSGAVDAPRTRHRLARTASSPSPRRPASSCPWVGGSSRSAAARPARWQRSFPTDPPLFISVNVSGKLFMKPDIVDRVMGILEETGLPPESLRLEVTENVVLEHVDTAVRQPQAAARPRRSSSRSTTSAPATRR